MNSANLRSRLSSTTARTAGVALLAVAAAASLALPSFADEGRGGGRHHRMHDGAGMPGGPMMMGGLPLGERTLDELKATPEQRAQIKQIRDAAATDMRAQQEQRRALHEESTRVFAQPNIDANAAEAVRQKSMALHDQASRRMLQATLDMQRVLTPEQRQQLAIRMAERRARMEQHMQQRQSRGGQPPAPAASR